MGQTLYESSIEFAKFLKKNRKKNGEKFLPSTIERYVDNINPYIPKLEKLLERSNKSNEFKPIIEYMNEEVKKRRSIVLFSAFKNYLFYKGIDKEKNEDVFKKLNPPPVNANAFNSKRFIQSKVLSREELKQIYYHTTDDFKRLIYSVLYDTACRRDELLSIRHKDIYINDPEKDKEDIESGVHGYLTVRGKGDKTRKVYLSKLSVDLYKKIFTDPDEDERVFIIRKNNGEPYKSQAQGLYSMIVKDGGESLNRHIHPHCWRHTRLTHLADEGADLLGIRAYAGHEDVATSQIYVEISSYIGKRVFSKYSKPIIGD